MERAKIEPVKAWLEGRCRIQYTDPLNGRVLEEIRGKNHVFEAQLSGLAALNTTALTADLVLTTGGFLPTDSDIPFLPGQPIGWGRVNSETQGAYRGQYRGADSYYNKKTTSKITNKYVYDFLPTQALGGPVNWVGLTAQFGQGAGTGALQLPKQYSSSLGTPCIVDCEDGVSFNLSYDGSNDSYYAKITRTDMIAQSKNETIDLSQLIGTFYRIYTYDIAAEAGGTDIFVAIRGMKTSSASTHWYIYRFDRDFTQTIAQYEIQGGNYNGNSLAGFFAGGKLYFYTVTDSGHQYQGYNLFALDLEALTSTYIHGSFPDQVEHNIFYPNNIVCRYGDAVWHTTYYWSGSDPSSNRLVNGSFVYESLLYDTQKGLMLCWPPNEVYESENRYMVMKNPLAGMEGQWIRLGYNGSLPDTPFAYTRYQVPEGTPARPEGSGMTVTYELDITL